MPGAIQGSTGRFWSAGPSSRSPFCVWKLLYSHRDKAQKQLFTINVPVLFCEILKHICMNCNRSLNNFRTSFLVAILMRYGRVLET